MIMESALFGWSFLCYLAATVLHIVYHVFKKEKIRIIALVLTGAGFALQTGALVLRTIVSRHAPFTNMYESLIFFSWMIILIYFILEYTYKLSILGAFVTPLAFISLGYASLLPEDYRAIEPLVPALQSRWLEVHVITCFIGYAAFAIAFSFGIMYLLKDRFKFKKLPSLELLDDMSHKTIALGFCFLALGIITGAIWANYAWGTYWSWDPKETWALVTWFIYAAYLHARVTAGWRGRKCAYLNILGFAAVIFTYVGVNFLLPGLHSYVK